MTTATVTTHLIPKSPLGCELIAHDLASQLEASILEEPITQWMISFLRHFDHIMRADAGTMTVTVDAERLEGDWRIERIECQITIGEVTLMSSIKMNMLVSPEIDLYEHLH